MTTKKEKFSKKDLVKIVNNKRVESINFESYFRRIIQNFIEEERNNFDIVEIIILTCTLLESVVKEKLREINPALLLDGIDTIGIAVLSNKQKKLISSKNKEIFIKTSSLKVLLDRYSLFFDINKYDQGMKYLISVRNNIVHSKDGHEINLLQLEASLCKYIFPFLEKNISVSKNLWGNFIKIADLIDDKYIQQLMKRIIKCQKTVSFLSEGEINKRLDDGFRNDSTEFARVRDLFCPACKLSSTTLVDGIDYEYEGPDEYSTHGYHYSICRVCGLELDSSDISAMLESYDKFFDNEDVAGEWYSVLEYDNYSDICDRE